MKIRMTQTAPGSVDGIRVQQYEAGSEYGLSDSPGAIDLAQAFVGAGFAVAVGGKAALESSATPVETDPAVDAAQTKPAKAKK